jgi:hypothetical protein
MSFLKGDIGEAIWVDHLEEMGHYDIETAPKRKFYDWDIKSVIDGKTYTFEVKYDSKAYWWAKRRNTPDKPNLYIEFKNTNKNEDSGIKASKATYYVYMLKDEERVDAYVFEREGLLSHLLSVTYKTAGNSATGDNNALGWIPPLDNLVTQKFFLQKVSLKV